MYTYILCAQGSEPEVLISAEHPLPVRVKRTYCSTHPSFRLVITQGNDEDSTQVIAKVNYMYYQFFHSRIWTFYLTNFTMLNRQ